MSSKINLQTCEYACKSSIFQDNQLIYPKNNKNFTKKYLRPLLDSGTLKMTIPNKPNSRNQKYITVRTE